MKQGEVAWGDQLAWVSEPGGYPFSPFTKMSEPHESKGSESCVCTREGAKRFKVGALHQR